MTSRLTLFFLLLPYFLYSQNGPQVIDMSWFMQPEQEFHYDYMYTVDGEFRLKYTYKSPETLLPFIITWKDPGSEKTVRNQALVSLCNTSDCLLSIRYDTLGNKGYHTLLLRDPEANKDFIIPLKANPKYTSPISLTDSNGEWLSSRYVTGPTDMMIESIDNSSIIYGYYYDDAFSSADPPTGARRSSSGNLQADSTFTLLDFTRFTLKKEGLYLFQTDSTSSDGWALRLENDRFPQYGRISELAAPMQYITSRSEWSILRKPGLSKNEFDRVWLSMAGTSTQAKAGIKYFYRGVYYANEYFTTYKSGWKTDKGMIYMIFGPPTRVTINGFTEEWFYAETLNHSQMEFSFSLVSTLFSPYHAILQRDKSFGYPWNKTVDRLRRGTPNYE